MSIQQLSAVEFRQKLAGLVDPAQVLPDVELASITDTATKLCCVLADLFSDDLDRKTLWERIGNGLEVCSTKWCNDWELFIEGLLEYVKANPGKVARNVDLADLITEIGSRPQNWKDQFIQICKQKRMFIIVNARRAWKLIIEAAL